MLSFVSFHLPLNVFSGLIRHATPACEVVTFRVFHYDSVRLSEQSTVSIVFRQHVQIGIDPRAASATRALLRLTPCHRAYLRTARGDTSGTPGSLELTGGEYKT